MPPINLRNGSFSSQTTMTVKMTRNTTAIAAPSAMPSLRLFSGRLRQASAMTTALSPDSSRSSQTIWKTWKAK